MITGRWAFAGQVDSSVGEADDGSPFQHATAVRRSLPTHEIRSRDRKITKAAIMMKRCALDWERCKRAPILDRSSVAQVPLRVHLPILYPDVNFSATVSRKTCRY